MNINFETKEIEFTPNIVINDYINDRFFDNDDNEQDFLRLVESIKTNGLINPLILAYDNKKPDEFELICGRRRIKAIREICKSTGNSFKAICRILPPNTDRQTRNIIAFQDNQNRKDLNENIKFFPLYLLIANSFYNVEQISKNSLIEIVDDKLRLYLKQLNNGESVEDTKTKTFIQNLSRQINIDERDFIKKIYSISQIDNNFFKIKRNFHIQTKELLKYKNSDNLEVKELIKEIFFIMNCINSINKNTPIDKAQTLCDKINEKIKSRFDLEFLPNQWLNITTSKENSTIIIQKYIKEIKEIIDKIKKPTKSNQNTNKVKKFLKIANEDEIEQILAFIEQLRKDK